MLMCDLVGQCPSVWGSLVAQHGKTYKLFYTRVHAHTSMHAV